MRPPALINRFAFSAVNTCSGREPRMLLGQYTQSGTGVPPVSDEIEKTGGTPVPLFQPLDQDGLIVRIA